MNGGSREAKYWGKYRGIVMNNIDPQQTGRLLISVPDVLSLTPSTWAEPCVPLAGPTGAPMGVHLLPPIGAGVWVEFEQGDPDHPIWVGCRWGAMSDLPPDVKLGNPASPSIVLMTMMQNAIIVSDMPGPTGGIMLRSQTGATIMINDLGITIQNGQGASIMLTGPTVTINETALVVT